MADTFPYRNKHTGVVQSITDEQAAVFGDQFEKLAPNWEQLAAEAEAAAQAVEAAKAEGAPKSDVKDAQKAADEAAAAAANAVTDDTSKGA